MIRGRIVIIVIISVALVLIAATYVVTWQLANDVYDRLVAPPITYGEGRFSPDQIEACVGQYMTYEFWRRVEIYPSVVWIAETWWSLDEEQTLVYEERQKSAIFPEPVEGFISDSVMVPRSLEPGPYQFRRASWISGSKPAIYVVDVNLVDCGE